MARYTINGQHVNADDIASAVTAYNALAYKSLTRGEELAPWGLSQSEHEIIVDYKSLTPEKLVDCIMNTLRREDALVSSSVDAE